MSSAHIVANQAGLPAGQPSVSRRDLVLGVPVLLRNADDDGVRSHRWRLVDRPSGSTVVIANKASAVAQFTPDVPGSYLVELQVDEALDGQVDRRVFAVLTDFAGLSPRPLRIPAAGEDNEANWRYDFGPTTTENRRGWMPDFVELILYAGLLAGPASTLAAVLLAGQLTGGRDIFLSAGDALRGAPGQPATVSGGEGVTGGGVVIEGADSLGPDGDGGNVTVRVGLKAGTGADGALTLTGGEGASVTLASDGEVAVSTPGDLTLTVSTVTTTAAAVNVNSSGGVSSTAAGAHATTGATVTRTSTVGDINDVAATHYTLTAGGDVGLVAAGQAELSGEDVNLTATLDVAVQAGQDVTVAATAALVESGASVTRSATAGGISDQATGAHSVVAASATRSVTGGITDTAATITRSATGALTDSAGTTYSLTAPTSASVTSPQVVLATAGANLRGTDGAAPTGFTVRGGDASAGDVAGGSLTVRSGNSSGTAAGTSLTLSPGGVGTGTRGVVRVSHPGPDTDRLMEHSTTGANGASVNTLVGTRNPSAAGISGSCGDIYHRDDGLVGEQFIKSAGNGNTTGWHKVGNTTLFARATVNMTISATVVESTIVNFTVPGGSMGTNGSVRVLAQGTFLANAVASTFTLRIKFGGTTIWQDVTPSIGISAALRAWRMDLLLVNTNNAGFQGGGGEVVIAAASTAAVGTGSLSGSPVGGPIRFTTPSIDTTVDQAFQVTVEHSSNNAGTQTARTAAVGIISMH